MKIDFSKLEITFKFRLEELENMIEVYTRQPKKSELEDGIRKDLRNIRVKVEERINTLQEEADNRPKLEDKLITANPTSVEHVK
jgi:hypothetical protein